MNSADISRRNFIKVAAAASLSGKVAVAKTLDAEKKQKKPNILVIVTDQQNANMLSCAGNKWVDTPALDSLAASGMRFEKCYCSNPVCVPSRFSIQTGHYPSRINIRRNSNSDNFEKQNSYIRNSIGWTFRDAGYETVYGGKVHLPGCLNEETRLWEPRADLYGYDILTTDERGALAEKCSEFLKRKHDKPFLLFASFINPHDICYKSILAGATQERLDRIPPGELEEIELELMEKDETVSDEEFFSEHCPLLPINHAETENEPEVMWDKTAHNGKWIRDNWSGKDWRLQRWAYKKLTEQIDCHVSTILKTLRENGLEEDTVVVFTSDHGELDGAHKRVSKGVLYEEAVNVPLIISYKNRIEANTVDKEHIVCNGLDLLPTLCDFAGIKAPEDLPGKSLQTFALRSKCQILARLTLY